MAGRPRQEYLFLLLHWRIIVLRAGQQHSTLEAIKKLNNYQTEKTDGDNEEGFSMADGIGFVFSNKLPCAKNIQRIQSIFVSRKGIVCVRRKADVTRCKEFVVRPFEHGDFIWCEIDLTMGTAAFWVEGPETEGYTNGPPQEKVSYCCAGLLGSCSCGFM